MGAFEIAYLSILIAYFIGLGVFVVVKKIKVRKQIEKDKKDYEQSK